MKRNIFITILLITGGVFVPKVYSQQQDIRYEYDASGNRIARQVLNVSSKSFKNQSTNEAEKEHLNKMLSQKDISVYPTPVRTELNINISELPESGYGLLLLFDMRGKLLFQKEISTAYTSVNMSNFLRGTYVLKLIFGTRQSVWKIMKE